MPPPFVDMLGKDIKIGAFYESKFKLFFIETKVKIQKGFSAGAEQIAGFRVKLPIAGSVLSNSWISYASIVRPSVVWMKVFELDSQEIAAAVNAFGPSQPQITATTIKSNGFDKIVFSIITLPKDNRTLQNCWKCGGVNKEIPLLMSMTKYCPVCKL